MSEEADDLVQDILGIDQKIQSLKTKKAALIRQLRIIKGDPDSNYALFRNIKSGRTFYSQNTPGEDMTRLIDGSIAYELIGYADSVEEALLKLHGVILP